MGEVSGDCVEEMLEYMYENEDEFRLILSCSQGTRYENMVHEMSEIEVQATHDFVETMNQNGRQIKSVDPMLEHMLTSGMFATFFELLLQDATDEEVMRALLKDSPIILLDEATASLDAENETMIQEAISRLIRNKTVIIIAHRMRTVSGADKIVVIDKGHVAEEGTPAKLLAKNGIYANMVRLQTGGTN